MFDIGYTGIGSYYIRVPNDGGKVGWRKIGKSDNYQMCKVIVEGRKKTPNQFCRGKLCKNT